MSGTQPWLAPGWRAEAEAWTRGSLRALGIEPSSPFQEFRARPWSSIWRIATPSGDVYFKALIPALKHEVALTERLAAMFPGIVVPVLAANVGRAWMLIPDAGARLRDVLKLEEAEAAWTKLLSECAEIQLETAKLVPEFLAMGVPDRRLQHFKRQFDSVLDIAERAARLGSTTLSADEIKRLTSLRPALTAVADKLASFGLPETVQHDDLHDGNVLVKAGRAVIFDWGDSSISHPFFTLRVSLLSLVNQFELSLEHPMLLRLRDGYLAKWQDYGPMPRLIEAYELSRPLAILPRVLTWDLAMASASDTEREDTAEVGLLKELLEVFSSS